MDGRIPADEQSTLLRTGVRAVVIIELSVRWAITDVLADGLERGLLAGRHKNMLSVVIILTYSCVCRPIIKCTTTLL